MKAIVTTVFLLAAFSCFSQSVFPALSPKGRIEQRIGNTDIIVDYERPAARGRKVFGGLVEYGKIWRTGAGNCTKIHFSLPVVIGNKRVDQGTYSLFSIPRKSEWILIINADTSLYGSGSYDEMKDVVRVKAKSAATGRYYESLTIDIDVVPNNAVVYITWENTQVSFSVGTETDKAANEFVENHLMTGSSKEPEIYAIGAEYYYFLGKELERALILIDQALAGGNESWYYRQKIDILEKQRKYQEAIDCANLAISVDNKRADWDLKSKQQSENEYRKRIEMFKAQLNNHRSDDRNK